MGVCHWGGFTFQGFYLSQASESGTFAVSEGKYVKYPRVRVYMLTRTCGVRVCMHEDRDTVRPQHKEIQSDSEYGTGLSVLARATVRERVRVKKTERESE